MSLVLLTLGNGDPVRCSDLDEAKARATLCSNEEGRIFVEITPQGGGPMTSLEFDRASGDWVVAS
jgi:hypothetical protein